MAKYPPQTIAAITITPPTIHIQGTPFVLSDESAFAVGSEYVNISFGVASVVIRVISVVGTGDCITAVWVWVNVGVGICTGV